MNHSLHIQALAARFERRLGKKLEAMNEKHTPEDVPRSGEARVDYWAIQRRDDEFLDIQGGPSPPGEPSLPRWVGIEDCSVWADKPKAHLAIFDYCMASGDHPGPLIVVGLRFVPSRREVVPCRGEARPEAGRDDAADWDPCRWCSAGIETVRHLPGGTCPRTGRTRPGRERATLTAERKEALLDDIKGAQNRLRLAFDLLSALESSGDPKEVK